MPTSAAGNKAFAAFTALLPVSVRQPGRPALGFTLIELLVVLALIAIGTAAVSLSFRDSSQTALEREAHRLAALLESARARSRASGMPVQWRAQQLIAAAYRSIAIWVAPMLMFCQCPC